MGKQLSVGDEVYMECLTSMGQSSTGTYKIEEVQQRYDEYTGEPFLIYRVIDEWYDGRNGNCYSNKKSMYYLEI